MTRYPRGGREEGEAFLAETTRKKSARVILLVVLPLLLVLTAGCGSQVSMGWSNPTVDEGVLYAGLKTGRLYALDADTGDELWAFPADRLLAGIYSSPVLREQVVFFGSYEIELSSFLIFQSQDIQGRAYAVDASNGAEKWHFPAGSSQETEPFMGTPATGDGLVYFTSSDGRVYALDIETGVERWRFESGDTL
jgi:outer membrane protein assembly factor BamB